MATDHIIGVRFLYRVLEVLYGVEASCVYVSGER